MKVRSKTFVTTAINLSHKFAHRGTTSSPYF